MATVLLDGSPVDETGAGLIDGWVRQETLETMVRTWLDGDFLDAIEDVVSHGLATVDTNGRVRVLPPVRRFVREAEEHAERKPALLAALADIAEEMGPLLYGAGTGTAMAGRRPANSSRTLRAASIHSGLKKSCVLTPGTLQAGAGLGT